MMLINYFLERYDDEHHCIHDLLPPLRASISYLRPKDHSFKLALCALELHKNLLSLDFCLNRPISSSAIRYAWFCESV